jgi:hypothetical protein
MIHLVLGVMALQGLRLELEVLLHGAFHEDRRAAAQAHHLRVRHPVGRRHDDLVARVQGGEQGVVDHLLAAGGHDGLRRLVVEAVLALELAGDGLAQGHDAGDRRVLGLAPADRRDGGFLDVVGGVEIRLADGKADHVPPLGFQIPRFLRDDDGCRRLDAGKGVRQKAHGNPPSGALRRDL